MDRSVGSPRTWSVVGVRGPGVSVFGLPELQLDSGILLDFALYPAGGTKCRCWATINSAGSVFKQLCSRIQSGQHLFSLLTFLPEEVGHAPNCIMD